MIKGLLLDVDGVLNGSLEGINTPQPSKKVMKALLSISNNGSRVVLCTGKGTFPLVETIKQGDFNNFHIANGGASIFNPFTGEDIGNFLDNELAKLMIAKFDTSGDYFEVYTSEEWYIKSGWGHHYRKNHTELLQQNPILVGSWDEFPEDIKIAKIVYFSEKHKDDDWNTEFFKEFQDKVELKWTSSLVLQPAFLAIMTRKGVSKASASKKVSEKLKISLQNFLGVGDSMSDWNFMELCGYAGVMGNAEKELKEIAKTKGDGRYSIGGHVDEDGILDILKDFEII